jgi:phosphate transport system permease protein
MKRPDAIDAAASVRPPRQGFARGQLGDPIFRALTTLAAALVLVLLAGLAVEMIRTSMPSLHRFGFGFLSGRSWDPSRDIFGAFPFLFGTLVSSLLALLIAVPISLGIAIFLAELAPTWLRGPVGLLVELLAAIPSVVYGLWGIFVLAPWLRTDVQPFLGRVLGWTGLFSGPGRGVGMLAAGLILSIMILPTVASLARDVLRAVPDSLREGALAIGATPWETVRVAVLPAARSGIVGAVILGLGRALGETMAVTMVIGNRAEVSTSLNAPGATMASVIANEYAEATGDLHVSALAEVGLLLFAVTLLLNLIARVLVWRVGRVPGGARM